MFFFQAEDGIRDLVRSRGLGDVYKRQGLGQIFPVVERTADADRMADGMHIIHVTVAGTTVDLVGPEPGAHEFLEQIQFFVRAAVSYTHLTLPTSDLV